LVGKSGDLSAAALVNTRRRILGPTYAEDPVRKLYGQLLHRADLAGVPRARSVTPAEFQHQLSDSWPDGAGDFQALTEAYQLRRYGDVHFEDEEVTALKRTWRRAYLLLKHQPRRVLSATAVVSLAGAQASLAQSPPRLPERSRVVSRTALAVLNFKPVAAVRHSTALRTMTVEIIGAIVAVLVLLASLIGLILIALNVLK
jgi:hypothetical protein